MHDGNTDVADVETCPDSRDQAAERSCAKPAAAPAAGRSACKAQVAELSDITGRLNLADTSTDTPHGQDDGACKEANVTPRGAAPAAAPTLKLPSFDLAGVAALISGGHARNVVVMVGAGISVAAGIPDFRTPGTGLYSRLEEYNLPFPEAVFHLTFFRNNPKPFYTLAKELFPGQYLPTATHHFLALLHDKGLLRRVFTQNIDSLELAAGLPADKVVAAHGGFHGAHCIDCKREASLYEVQAAVFDDDIATCRFCGGLVKPDIVMFGEQLPARFHRRRADDLPAADLLIVMGTSLVVHPFAGLIGDVADDTPRLLINREPVALAKPLRMRQPSEGQPSIGSAVCASSGSDADDASSDSSATTYRSDGFDPEGFTRDVMFLGSCDAGVWELARLLGWAEELDARVAAASAAHIPAAAASE